MRLKIILRGPLKKFFKKHFFFWGGDSYPPLPVTRKIAFEELSAYTRLIFGQDGRKATAAAASSQTSAMIGKRLVSDLDKKTDVLLHYVFLKDLLRLGVRAKVSQVLVVDQKPFMRPFVSFHKTKRDQASDDFTKLMHKFILNAIYGKVENVE